jgi:hypothetical protein
MKHAGAAALQLLDDLLVEIRKRSALRERTPGSFYFKSKGYLHFHEDPAGIFADVKLDLVDFTRLRATTAAEQRALLKQPDHSLAAQAHPKR